jgi:hypothetical protein
VAFTRREDWCRSPEVADFQAGFAATMKPEQDDRLRRRRDWTPVPKLEARGFLSSPDEYPREPWQRTRRPPRPVPHGHQGLVRSAHLTPRQSARFDSPDRSRSWWSRTGCRDLLLQLHEDRRSALARLSQVSGADALVEIADTQQLDVLVLKLKADPPGPPPQFKLFAIGGLWHQLVFPSSRCARAKCAVMTSTYLRVPRRRPVSILLQYQRRQDRCHRQPQWNAIAWRGR